MPRGDQVIRQWKLLWLLESRRGRTLKELAQELGCCARTVIRDLDHLQQVGFPLYDEREGKRKRWRLLEAGFRPPFPFTLTELMALSFSRSLVKPLDGTLLHASLEAFFDKLHTLLPEPAHVLLSQLQKTMAAGRIPLKDCAPIQPVIEAVTQARLGGRTLEITYHSFSRNEVSTRRIDPYHLWYHQGGFYVIAYDHLRREVRIFALERIKALRETEETFASPSSFDVEAYMRESFGLLRGGPAVPVKVKFSKAWARWIAERRWHPSQQLERLPGGELVLSLEVAVTDDLKRWILSFGREAEVVEPVALREAVRAEAQALLEQMEIEDLARELSALQLTLPVMVGG